MPSSEPDRDPAGIPEGLRHEPPPELAGVLARDARYALQAYEFVFEAIEYAKRLKKQAAGKPDASRAGRACHPARAASQAAATWRCATMDRSRSMVLNQWGIRSTSDLGEIVFNLIASGDLEKTPTDSPGDFDDVFDFETAFRTTFAIRAAAGVRAGPTERPMSKPRILFLAALALFVIWVAALAVLAAVSAQRPPPAAPSAGSGEVSGRGAKNRLSRPG